MSRYAKPPEKIIERNEEPMSIDNNDKWSIKDTEFLLRLIMSSKIDGSDLEIAADVVKKIKTLHAKILNHRVVV